MTVDCLDCKRGACTYHGIKRSDPFTVDVDLVPAWTCPCGHRSLIQLRGKPVCRQCSHARLDELLNEAEGH